MTFFKFCEKLYDFDVKRSLYYKNFEPKFYYIILLLLFNF